MNFSKLANLNSASLEARRRYPSATYWWISICK